MARETVNRVMAHSVVVVALLSTWEVIARSWTIFRFAAGMPSRIAVELWSLIADGRLHMHMGVTAWEAAAGLAIGTTSGTIVGLGLWYSGKAAEIAKPYIVAIGAIPVFAFAPLMIMWFGVGISMKIAIAAFSTFFVALTQSYRGAQLVGPEFLEPLHAMRATRRQVFFKVIVPGSLDWVLASARMNVGFGLLGAFVGEFVASDRGVGHVMLRAAGLYNVDRAFAAVIGIVVLAILFDLGASYLQSERHRLVQWVSVPRRLWRR